MVTGSFVKLWFHEMALEFLKDKTTCQFFFLFFEGFCKQMYESLNQIQPFKDAQNLSSSGETLHS